MKRRQILGRSAALAAAWGSVLSLAPPAHAAPHPGATPAPPRAARREGRPAHAAPKRRAAAAAGQPDALQRYAGHPAVAAFAQEVARRRDWDASWIESQLAQARRLPAVQRLIMPPPTGTAKNWTAYRARFVEPSRIEAGLRFWHGAQHWLDRAQQRFGVPPSIVVAIVGVETFYGRIVGGHRLIDALATLSFDFPAGRRDRSGFFRSELEELLAWAWREGFDPATLRGSYAGAWGLPQFMPGSINRFAVDFDGDGRIDLMDSVADVVGSVARYLAAFGWQRGLPTHHGVQPPADAAARSLLLAPDIVPSFTVQQMTGLGAVLDAGGSAHDGLLALVELHNGSAEPSYVAGTENFYVITRYNWSSYYALAVIELAQALERGRRGTTAST